MIHLQCSVFQEASIPLIKLQSGELQSKHWPVARQQYPVLFSHCIQQTGILRVFGEAFQWLSPIPYNLSPHTQNHCITREGDFYASSQNVVRGFISVSIALTTGVSKQLQPLSSTLWASLPHTRDTIEVQPFSSLLGALRPCLILNRTTFGNVFFSKCPLHDNVSHCVSHGNCCIFWITENILI